MRRFTHNGNWKVGAPLPESPHVAPIWAMGKHGGCAIAEVSLNPEAAWNNARAMAAAPDLLEALEDIARGPLQGPSDFTAYAQRRASAAIAKTYGADTDG